ncbi:MAG: DNA polymerase IV [bacterium]
MILHLDADAFFASCEQARNPHLRGKPLVVGQERGIATAVSYEAKALGVRRCMRTGDIRKNFPTVVVLPSDYNYYAFISARFFEIVKKFTPTVEQYSIDECFADLTGLRRLYRAGYVDIASNIKNSLERQLGLSFSLGLAPTKVLAKIASSCQKPSGLVEIERQNIKHYLESLPLNRVWGIGPQTAAYLSKLGVGDTLDLAQRPQSWVLKNLNKTGVEIWRELCGEAVYQVETSVSKPLSCQRFRTFYPAIADPLILLAKTSYHTECLCARLRRFNLVCPEAAVVLRNDNFQYKSFKVKLPWATSCPGEILKAVRPGFENFLRGRGKEAVGERYRTCGVVLTKLKEKLLLQLPLFESYPTLSKEDALFKALDAINCKFGNEGGFLASSKLCGELVPKRRGTVVEKFHPVFLHTR